jgi:hypothetical protein
METKRQRLSEVMEHQLDIPWLRSNQNEIYILLNHSLLNPPLAMEAIETLCSIYGKLDPQQNPNEDWRYILSIALDEAATLKDTIMQAQLYLYLAPDYLATGEHSPAREVFLNALMLQKSLSPEAHLMVILGLIKSESLYHKDHGDEYYLKEAQNLISQVTQRDVVAIYHEALALIYLTRGTLQPALENALMAVYNWHHLNDAQKIIDSTFILADVYRYMKAITAHTACVEFLAECIEPQNKHDYALLHYHRASNHLYSAQYAEAVAAYQTALEGFEGLRYPLLTHSCQQALALALYCVQDFDQGDYFMGQAIEGWQALKNDYQVMDAYRTQGFGYHQYLHFNEAIRAYETALTYREQGAAASDAPLVEIIEHLLKLARNQEPPQ